MTTKSNRPRCSADPRPVSSKLMHHETPVDLLVHKAQDDLRGSVTNKLPGYDIPLANLKIIFKEVKSCRLDTGLHLVCLMPWFCGYQD